MTQYADPCWHLVYANGEPVDTGDAVPHFATDTAARQDAPRYAVRGEVPVPERLDKPCVPAIRCGGCDETPDDNVTDYGDQEQAEQAAKDAGWIYRGGQWWSAEDCMPEELTNDE